MIVGDWSVDLRELRYFVGVAELRNFSKAAAALRIAQPALSRQVRKLEDRLGVELFTRHARGVELTEAGELLLQRSYGLFRQLDQTLEDVTARSDNPSGVVTIGIPPATGELLIPTLAERVRQRLPNVRLGICEGFSAFVYERLLNRQINLAVLHNPVPHRELNIMPLLVEQMYVVTSAHRPGPELHRLAELAHLPLILPQRPHSLRLLMEDAAARQDVDLNVAYEVDGLGIIKSMVARDLGCTTLAFSAVHQEFAKGVLRAAPIIDPPIHWTLAMVSRVDQGRSRAMVAVQQLIIDVVRDAIASGLWRGDPLFDAARPHAEV